MIDSNSSRGSSTTVVLFGSIVSGVRSSICVLVYR